VNGFGIIGASVALVLNQFPGVRVFVNDANTDRRQIADSMGLKLWDKTNDEHFDISFNATAKGDGLQFCIDKTGYEGVIVELSWFGTGLVELKLGTSFHIRRQRIISSQVSQIPGSKLSRWDFKRRKELVFELLKNPIFDLLLATQVPFSQAPEIFDAIRQGSLNNICITFTY
jgi:threonine dehydrogenase-like Zn-dependent dehydrogenase